MSGQRCQSGLNVDQVLPIKEVLSEHSQNLVDVGRSVSLPTTTLDEIVFYSRKTLAGKVRAEHVTVLVLKKVPDVGTNP